MFKSLLLSVLVTSFFSLSVFAQEYACPKIDLSNGQEFAKRSKRVEYAKNLSIHFKSTFQLLENKFKNSSDTLNSKQKKSVKKNRKHFRVVLEILQEIAKKDIKIRLYQS